MKDPLIDRLERRVREATRRRNPPSDRDARVYEQVQVLGRRQVDVATELGISQGRVAQICRAVGQWCREELDPASQGPEQFRALADLLCELAYLRLLVEQAGQSPKSASRQEVFWHAAQTYVAQGPGALRPNISASKASIRSDPPSAVGPPSSPYVSATNHDLPMTSSELQFAVVAASNTAKNANRSEFISANNQAAPGGLKPVVQ